MKKTVLLSFISIITIHTLSAQLTVTAEPNDTAFIYSLAGPGIVVSDLTRTCADNASGFFNSMSANVGIDSGIILTSGNISNTLGPNDNGSASVYNMTDGDADLSGAAGVSTLDGCVIEFNMTVAADTLKLKYVFGSEEYPEFVGSFNDIFAFWVSGPGIPDPVNIALVPGTTLPVAINNVNSMTNSDYYIANGTGWEAPYNTDPMYIQYDGFTTVLTASTPVTAGETYHMKIAIADALDGIYDSGVFLETGSLGSLRLNHNAYADNDLDKAVEKCSNGYLKFTNQVVSDQPLVIDYHIGGTASNGVDYTEIPEQLTIPAGDSIGIIEIVPLHDAIPEGLESVELFLYNPQSGFVYDTVSILIDDELDAANFVAAPSGTTVSFTDISGVAVGWDWDFDDGATSAEAAPTHEYAAAGTYHVCLTITDALGCTDETCQDITVGTLGVEDAYASFTIKPNPVEGNFNIQLPESFSGNTIITVKNNLGQTIQTLTTTNGQAAMDISEAPAGIYFIEVKNNSTTLVKQIQKI